MDPQVQGHDCQGPDMQRLSGSHDESEGYGIRTDTSPPSDFDSRTSVDPNTITSTETGAPQHEATQVLLAANTSISTQPQGARGLLASAGAWSDTLSPSPPSSSGPTRPNKRVKCRYFGTKNGCRAGTSCPFLHEVSPSALTNHPLRPEAPALTKRSTTTSSTQPVTEQGISSRISDSQRVPVHVPVPPPRQDVSSDVPFQGRRYLAKPVDESGVMPKPVSHVQVSDARGYQIRQIRRRFSPRETTTVTDTSLAFNMKPSDPDFPFDLDSLQCVMTIPKGFPRERPTLQITNPEMGRGFQINIERGFDALVERNPSGTLLSWMNALDRQLEALLTEKKAETLKIISNARPKDASQPSDRVSSGLTAARPPSETIKLPGSQSPKTYSPEEKARASSRRAFETRQLEARLGRGPLFSKSSDNLSYVLPFQSVNASLLPVALQSVRTVKLIVPTLYNLQPCRIELPGVDTDVSAYVEMAFNQKAAEHPEMSLMAHVNYLSQNLHAMAKEPKPNPIEPDVAQPQMNISSTSMSEASVPKDDGTLDARSHVRFIPRPPEWSVPRVANQEESESSDYDSEEEDSEDDEEGGATLPEPAPTSTARGVLMSFPHVELYGIELLEVVSPSLTVKCERCKDQLDVKNLKHNSRGDASGLRNESCKKCANLFCIGFRREVIHANSVRAGYLDLDGCTVVDLLPSTFQPTCSGCSTMYPATGVVSVRGESTMAICRECHLKMTFKLPEVKFLMVSPTVSLAVNRPPPKRKGKEKLGIVSGTELPKRGRCVHYGKSYRWFRFSCCNKVFPCDRCHDEQTDHPNEHAHRMICGYCSREQIYRPEDCGICRATLLGRRGGGFWEGGKGTRDKVKMNRKDPRKYKRRGGGNPVGGATGGGKGKKT